MQKDSIRKALMIAADIMLVWYVPELFSVANTFANIIGVGLIFLFTFLTLKTFKVV